MKVKTVRSCREHVENTTYYSDPEKWLPTQQRFQLKESPKIRPCLQNTRPGKNVVTYTNQGFQQHFAILKNIINCISFNIYDLFQNTQMVQSTSQDCQLLFPTEPWLAFLNKQQREMSRFCWSWGRGTPATGPGIWSKLSAEQTKDSMWNDSEGDSRQLSRCTS